MKASVAAQELYVSLQTSVGVLPDVTIGLGYISAGQWKDWTHMHVYFELIMPPHYFCLAFLSCDESRSHAYFGKKDSHVIPLSFFPWCCRAGCSVTLSSKTCWLFEHTAVYYPYRQQKCKMINARLVETLVWLNEYLAISLLGNVPQNNFILFK